LSMSDHLKIADLSEGDDFVGFYALRRCDLREYDGGHRLDIELGDQSGAVPGVVWDKARELKESLNKGDVVKVKGRLGSYRDRPQVRVDQIRSAKEGEYDPESFVPSTPKDIDDLLNRVQALVGSITDPNLSSLATMIFENRKFLDDYTKSPGGMQWHHPYLGGLLEHSVGVAEMCDFIASRNPELNRDLLVLAGLLHDVGKIKEYSATTLIEFTDEGRLEGHIVIGERFMRHMCDRIEGFPPKIRMLLSHLMLSHQGHKEFSSPVEPMIPEGFVLYYADELDSKLNAVTRVVRQTQEENKTWSDYIRIINRYIYADSGKASDDSHD